MATIRPYQPQDLDDLYAICLATGDAGADGSQIYRDPKLLGEIYAAPYAHLHPQLAFVVEDDEGVGGYIVGALDTYKFEMQLEEKWWPSLRIVYPDPPLAARAQWSPDQRMSYTIHHPPRTPRRISEPFASHLHINLLPRLQGSGLGRALVDRWLAQIRAMGGAGVHLAVGSRNERAVKFYRHYGFREIERTGPPFDVIWFAINADHDRSSTARGQNI